MDKSKVPRFLWPTVYMVSVCVCVSAKVEEPSFGADR